MKVYINLILALIIFPVSLLAHTDNDSILVSSPNELELDCDACGCSATSTSNGIENLINSNYIGVRYLHQYYKAKEDAFSTKRTQKQHFNTILLWTRIPINSKIDINASIPYHFHQKDGENSTSISGIGDLNMMGIVKIINSNSNSNELKHGLSAAVGVKIPIAKFDQKNAQTTNPSFQLGTGSWDTQFGLNYQLTYKNSAIQLVTDYNLKGENKNKYKFGNQWNQLIQLQHLLVRNDNKFLGKIGFQNELYNKNEQFGESIPNSSGNAQFVKLGLEAAVQKINFGIEYFQPLHSNLNSGEIEVKNRIGFFLNYNLFQSKNQ
ncbi:hypothetical protein OBK03_09915 [Empedobacter falsenii]